ncbi:hypothetical protein G6F56_012416 [Rhizopus delemar]|nr:hypothetical protein G6F56_012416 [Rhizopus delemar]
MKQAKVQFADKKKDNYRTLTPKARLLVLVQFLMQQRSCNNAGTTRSVKLEYNPLRSHAKDVHARMLGCSLAVGRCLQKSTCTPSSKNGSIPVASSSRALPPASVQAPKRDGSVVSSTESETDQFGDHSPSPPSLPSRSPSPLPPKRQNKGKGKAPSKSRSKGKGKRKEQESDSEDDGELRQVTRRAVKVSRQQEEQEERTRAARYTDAPVQKRQKK